ncbi:MHYT domain-containing protein [Phyllobacterium zundukense]|uniref:MHYT domain-containing protein n=1 Tax=Phyllobacterium zundukense TaxID=1867719 RepID=UPI000C56C837|nr:MHYT domain-containing protein [Phyllobacterium zundukense]ATU92948.1 hypothetical protein BLM14_15985 [Phyllobacterium zundukense]
MLTVYNCIVNEHDLRLVLLAATVCIFASYAAANLLRHARRAIHKQFWAWVVAVAFGCGIWATHFIAMLAFSPNLPHGYNAMLTAASLLMAIAMTGLGALFAVTSERPNADLAGGAIIGAGIAAMHFTGMAAFEVEGRIVWNPVLVTMAVALGIVFGAAAVCVAKAVWRTGLRQPSCSPSRSAVTTSLPWARFRSRRIHRSPFRQVQFLLNSSRRPSRWAALLSLLPA